MSHYQAPNIRRRVVSGESTTTSATPTTTTNSTGSSKKSDKITTNSVTSTPLMYRWTMWYHSPESNIWTSDSYKKIFTITSIEEFWACYELIKEQYLSLGMFFLMREGIEPTWEDPQNITGGCWSFKVGRKDTYNTWLELSIALLGNTLVKQHQSQMLVNLLTGISISPKKGFCIIKIWNRDSQFSDSKLLTDSIPGIILEESIYKSFSDESDSK